jgi:hypothetical protein
LSVSAIRSDVSDSRSRPCGTVIVAASAGPAVTRGSARAGSGDDLDGLRRRVDPGDAVICGRDVDEPRRVDRERTDLDRRWIRGERLPLAALGVDAEDRIVRADDEIAVREPRDAERVLEAAATTVVRPVAGSMRMTCCRPPSASSNDPSGSAIMVFGRLNRYCGAFAVTAPSG